MTSTSGGRQCGRAHRAGDRLDAADDHVRRPDRAAADHPRHPGRSERADLPTLGLVPDDRGPGSAPPGPGRPARQPGDPRARCVAPGGAGGPGGVGSVARAAAAARGRDPPTTSGAEAPSTSTSTCWTTRSPWPRRSGRTRTTSSPCCSAAARATRSWPAGTGSRSRPSGSMLPVGRGRRPSEFILRLLDPRLGRPASGEPPRVALPRGAVLVPRDRSRPGVTQPLEALQPSTSPSGASGARMKAHRRWWGRARLRSPRRGRHRGLHGVREGHAAAAPDRAARVCGRGGHRLALVLDS